MNKIISDGNKFYEIDEKCMKKKEQKELEQQSFFQNKEKMPQKVKEKNIKNKMQSSYHRKKRCSCEHKK